MMRINPWLPAVWLLCLAVICGGCQREPQGPFTATDIHGTLLKRNVFGEPRQVVRSLVAREWHFGYTQAVDAPGRVQVGFFAPLIIPGGTGMEMKRDHVEGRSVEVVDVSKLTGAEAEEARVVLTSPGSP